MLLPVPPPRICQGKHFAQEVIDVEQALGPILLGQLFMAFIVPVASSLSASARHAYHDPAPSIDRTALPAAKRRKKRS